MKYSNEAIVAGTFDMWSIRRQHGTLLHAEKYTFNLLTLLATLPNATATASSFSTSKRKMLLHNLCATI